jgi:hypothetical protein
MSSRNYDHLTDNRAFTFRLSWTKNYIKWISDTRLWNERKRHQVRIIFENFCFLGCNIVQLGRELSTFRRNLLLRYLWQPWIRRYILNSTKLEPSIPTRVWRLRFWWGSGFQYFRRSHKVTKSDYCLRPACLSVHAFVQKSVCMEQVVSHWKDFGQIL